MPGILRYRRYGYIPRRRRYPGWNANWMGFARTRRIRAAYYSRLRRGRTRRVPYLRHLLLH